MELTVQEILQMKEVLQKILGVDIPVKTAFRLGKLAVKLQEELQFFQKTRLSLLEKYGTINKEDDTVSIEDEDKRKQFTEDIQQVLSEQINIDFNPINISDLGEDLKISAAEIIVLERIIKEDIKEEGKNE